MHTYTHSVARHYSAYRPSLHADILRCALGVDRFTIGLDIGCGAGHSSRALTRYCQHVIGADESIAMVRAAPPHPDITFLSAEGTCLPIKKRTLSIVTLAGVLSYLNRSKLLSELVRVCSVEATIIVYDFRVDLDPVLSLLSLPHRHAPAGYNHAANLNNADGVTNIHQEAGQVDLPATYQDIMHLLLSSERRYNDLVDRFGAPGLEARICDLLNKFETPRMLTAYTWFSRHQLTAC